MRKSRISKYNESKSRKTTILSIVGIVIVLFLFIKFGLGFLVNFSLFLSGGENKNNSQDSNKIDFIPAPLLNPVISATNSAHIIISGKSAKDYTVYLHINGTIVDQTVAEDNGNFSFNETLVKGTSQIYAVSEYKDLKSDSSNSYTVYFSNSQPNLEVSSPTEGQSFPKDQNSVTVAGKTEFGVKVTVNGFWAVIDDSNNFTYTLNLSNGENQIKILATDQAGNQTEKSLKVTYSQ